MIESQKALNQLRPGTHQQVILPSFDVTECRPPPLSPMGMCLKLKLQAQPV